MPLVFIMIPSLQLPASRLKISYHSLLAIFERSQKDNRPCSEIADKIAREKLS